MKFLLFLVAVKNQVTGENPVLERVISDGVWPAGASAPLRVGTICRQDFFRDRFFYFHRFLGAAKLAVRQGAHWSCRASSAAKKLLGLPWNAV